MTRVERKECNDRESVCDNSKSVRGIDNLRKRPALRNKRNKATIHQVM